MRKIVIPMLIVALLALAVVGVQGQGGGNLLRNPSFEGEPVIWEGAGEVKIVPEWSPYHWDDLAGFPAISDGNLNSVHTARPEYRPATLGIDPLRVRTGAQSQMWFSFYRNHYAGVFQGEIPVQVGQTYAVSVWAQAWSSGSDDPRKSDNEFYMSIGINPRGDCSLKARDTVWGNWEYVGSTFKQLKSQPVVMIKDKACVFIGSSTKYSVKHNDAYIDDAEMLLVPGGTVCPAPTPCPSPTLCPACPQPTPSPSGDCLTKGQFDVGIADVLTQIEALLKRLILVLK
jgi:hypothetical protein